MLYILSIVQLAIMWQLSQTGFVNNGETRETIFAATYFNPPWAILASEGSAAVTNILADGLLVSTAFTIPCSGT